MYNYTVNIFSRLKMQDIQRENKQRSLIREVLNARRQRLQREASALTNETTPDSHN